MNLTSLSKGQIGQEKAGNFAPSLKLSRGTQTASQRWTITLCPVGSAKVDFPQARATHPAIFHF